MDKTAEKCNRFRIRWPEDSKSEFEIGTTLLSFVGFINERFGSAYAAFVDRGGEVDFHEDFTAEEAAAETQRLADEAAAETQRLADEAAAETQRLADEAAAETQRLADEERGAERRAAEARDAANADTEADAVAAKTAKTAKDKKKR